MAYNRHRLLLVPSPGAEALGFLAEAPLEKLEQGGRFPKLALKLVRGDTLVLPREAPSRYLTLLFYRGHW